MAMNSASLTCGGPTTTGRETAEQFAKYLSARGLTITSGLATGIDGASHRGALPELGGTIAVLGSGMKGYCGILGRLFSVVARNNVSVIAVAQGASELNICFAVTNSRVDDVVRAVHQEFLGAEAAN